jgi:hypothetical protein
MSSASWPPQPGPVFPQALSAPEQIWDGYFAFYSTLNIGLNDIYISSTGNLVIYG